MSHKSEPRNQENRFFVSLNSKELIDEAIRTSEATARATLEALGPCDDFRSRWQVLAQSPVLAAGHHHPDGQSELGAVTAAVARIEGIGRAGAPTGLVYSIASQLFGLHFPLRRMFGDVPEWLTNCESGEVMLCHALTEEGGGSDPLAMDTSAEPTTAGSYVVTGRKAFVTAAPVADQAIVFARTSAGRHPFALTAFRVDLHAPRATRSAPFPKTALRDVPMGAIDFDQAPAGQPIGAEGSGLALLSATTTWERAFLLSYALGPMHLALQKLIQWSSTRQQFGRLMGSSHLVAARLADMAICLFRARQMIYHLAAEFDNASTWRPMATIASMAKISLAEDYAKFCAIGASLGGARSYVEESGLTADLATAAAASTYAGPNDLLRIAIARDLGLPVEN